MLTTLRLDRAHSATLDDFPSRMSCVRNQGLRRRSDLASEQDRQVVDLLHLGDFIEVDRDVVAILHEHDHADEVERIERQLFEQAATGARWRACLALAETDWIMLTTTGKSSFDVSAVFNEFIVDRPISESGRDREVLGPAPCPESDQDRSKCTAEAGWS